MNFPNAQKINRTAIIYVHGMGFQNRRQEISNLIEAIDRYTNRNVTDYYLEYDDPEEFILRSGEVEECFRINKCSSFNNNVEEKYYFFEAYWAPLTDTGVPTREVLKWFFYKIIHPVKTLSSPWRVRARLRLAALYKLMDKEKYREKYDSEAQEIIRLYNNFETRKARNDFNRGSYSEFRNFVCENADESYQQDRLLELLGLWRRHYGLIEIWNFFLIMTILLIIGLGVYIIGITITELFTLIMQSLGTGDQTFNSPLFVFSQITGTQLLSILFEISFANIVAIVNFLLSITGIRFFLEHFMGDVQIWTTYHEADPKHKTRNKIRNFVADYVRSALEDVGCDRAIVIAHSLGTSIAVEAISYLANKNANLNNITHFITFGSPIDKIQYFFESSSSNNHQYILSSERKRRDIGSEPFTINRKPKIHWINIWDRGDIISGKLFSPNPRKSEAKYSRVNNVHTNSYYFPHPNKCHRGYISNFHALSIVHKVIFNNEYNLQNFSFNRRGNNIIGVDYDEVYGITSQNGIQNSILLGLLIGIPWIFSAFLIFQYYNIPILIELTKNIFFILSSVAIFFALLSLIRGERNPI